MEAKVLMALVYRDLSRDLDKRSSLTGYMFLLNGSLLNWKVSLQYVVALLTIKAKHTAAAESVKEAIWLKVMLAELGIKQESISISCDSSSTLHLCKNPAYHKRTKHVDIKLHFIRNEISRGTKMVKVHTHNNPSDMLTTMISVDKFRKCLNLAAIFNLH